MSSISVSVQSIDLTCPSHYRRKTNFSRFQKQLRLRQPKTMAAITTDTPIVRRSANYPPSDWSHDFLQSLPGNNESEKCKSTLHNLKERVRTIISEETSMDKPLRTLELVDDLQRLGIAYHFKDEISSMLKIIYNRYYEARANWNRFDLNVRALGFRLLRQHGYHIPQEIFEEIKDETGNIKTSVYEDIVGMLNLYEASFFDLDDENILDEAREFTSKCLKEKLNKNNSLDQSMFMLISHALEQPLHWRIPRLESIWFIEAYKVKSNMIPLLLEFAILDFNIVQGIHQEDLKYSSRWWMELQWDKKLSFARDRMVESCMWAIASNHEPSFGDLRRLVTMFISMANVVDDVYDVYGTLDELEKFTEVVRRWDVNAVEGLPDYMKICFLGFYNTINQMGYDTLTKHGSFVIPYVKKAWTDYFERVLVEAQWFNSGYIPTLEEYLKNSHPTIGIPVIVSSAYFLDSNDNIGEALQNVIYWSSIVLRLTDDLGTSSAELARGDIPKSLQCYMHETGVSEEEAREYIKKLIIEAYKKINKERMACKSPYLQIYMECAANHGRMGQFTYERGDIFGTPDDLYKSQQKALLFNPKS